jgi:zinc protease
VEDLDLLLDILAEALRFPTFPEKHIEQQRARILTGLDLRAQSTYDQAALAFDSLVYPNHPYSRPEEGHPETVRVVRLTDIKAFHAKHYGPKGMRVAVVGGIDPQKAIEKVQAALGDWENPQQPAPPDLPPWSPLSKSQQVRVDVSGKSQSDLILGTAGPARGAPNFLAASLGNNILGQFGMMGRIGEVVREEAGLAYYASSNVSGSLGPGPWSVSAGVNPKNENQAIELILKEIRRFVTELVSEDELSDSQANYIGSLPLSLESNRGVASSLLHLEKHNLGLDYYVRYPALVRAVTRQDVLAAASRYLDPDKFAVAVAGPPK